MALSLRSTTLLCSSAAVSASLLLLHHPLRHATSTTTSFANNTYTYFPNLRARCDAAPLSTNRTSQTTTTTPTTPQLLKQFSAGSLIGLTTGLALAAFSRPLALLLGLLVLGVQAVQSTLRIDIVGLVPWKRMAGRAWKGAAGGSEGEAQLEAGRVLAWVRSRGVFWGAFGVTCGLAGYGQFE